MSTGTTPSSLAPAARAAALTPGGWAGPPVDGDGDGAGAGAGDERDGEGRAGGAARSGPAVQAPRSTTEQSAAVRYLTREEPLRPST